MNAQELIAFFMDLHRHPELGLHEFETTRKIREKLEAHGVLCVPSSLATGLTAVIQGSAPGRTIALRTDLDALPVQEETGLSYASEVPGVMHACGHDFHATVMLGAALRLQAARDRLKGCVKVIFQPAEEISEGGAAMAREDLFGDVEEFYAIHTYQPFETGTLGIKEGPVMAAPDSFSLTFTGKGTHAGQPHKGVDPIPAMCAFVLEAQTICSRTVNPFEPVVVSIAHVSAGTAWNVIPGTAFAEGTVRTLCRETRTDIRNRLERMAAHIAEAHGLQADFRWRPGPDPVINDPDLCRACASLAREMGFHVARQEDCMLGEDFSEFLRRAPGVLIRVGTGGQFPNHHPGFTADPQALERAADFFARLAMERAGLT